MQEIVFSSAVTLEFSRVYPVSPETVWHAITDSAQISDWMGYPCTLDPRLGGLFTIGVDNPIEHAVVCCVDPNRALVTMFRETLVFQIIEGDSTQTTHRLRQVGVMPESAVSFACGWHVLLDRLAGHITGDISEIPYHQIETQYEEQFRAYAQTHGMMRPT